MVYYQKSTSTPKKQEVSFGIPPTTKLLSEPLLAVRRRLESTYT